LNIAAENCLKITIEFGALFKEEVGGFAHIKRHYQHLDRKRRQSTAKCQRWKCAYTITSESHKLFSTWSISSFSVALVL